MLLRCPTGTLSVSSALHYHEKTFQGGPVLARAEVSEKNGLAQSRPRAGRFFKLTPDRARIGSPSNFQP